MIPVIFTTQEVQVLLTMIDIAVKSQGIAAAEAGIVLTKKLQQFEVLTIGPGGRICGPATVRLDKDLEALTLSKGVCIPAEEK